MGLSAYHIQKYIPPPIIKFAGGRKEITRLLTEYLPWITQAGANQVENVVSDATKVIKSAKQRGALSKKAQQKAALKALYQSDQGDDLDDLSSDSVGFDPGLPGFEEQMKQSKALVEAVIKRLLSEQPYKTPGQEYIACLLYTSDAADE